VFSGIAPHKTPSPLKGASQSATFVHKSANRKDIQLPPYHTYRRRKDKDTWHFCRNCEEWPTSDYSEQSGTERPTTGELCNRCKGKEAGGDCK
jgi:hypothetical protein